MNSDPSSQTQVNLFSEPTQAALFANPARRTVPLVLEIRGLIPPSFKNNRMVITKGPGGRPLQRPLLIVKPEYQKQIAVIVESFVAQLLSAFQTDAGATPTAFSRQSWTSCNMPGDDSLTDIPEIHIRTEWVAKGQEGVTVTIERLR